MQFRNILLEEKNEIGFLSLNRPETRNALDATILKELEEGFHILENQPDIRIIVIQSSSDKAFAAGADIKALHSRSPLDALIPGMQALYNKIENCTKPTIALVNGFALGGGCELALACDIRIATERAKFGLPELNLGIIPGAGGTQRLARTIGKGRALDLILTGKIIDCREAERIGLATYFTPIEELETLLTTITDNILKKAPLAIQLAKMVVHKGFDIDLQTAQWIEKLSSSVLFGTEDKKEGTLAFIEKRAAQFSNK
ncbi:enoyl-CoA hydratase/isomerase family protein [Rummeliibacillus pycnus]|uniref:enoyl-CoA hydratase/isomerase family protein n=1 Tax=Rummeliibacillus pycnus TaxID=101070 RepID=UPI000C9CB1CD|nr:enoyl-CoA hydratase-related protein [Rummeliibacillus pycnus]